MDAKENWPGFNTLKLNEATAIVAFQQWLDRNSVGEPPRVTSVKTEASGVPGQVAFMVSVTDKGE